MIDKAIAFAAVAHTGQTRKYTGEPYIIHTIEVMMLVRKHAETYSEAMLIAALLHDVVEDTATPLADIEAEFGPEVANLVVELTDVYVSEAFPDMNRKARKQAERNRLSEISPEGQTIKIADMISNTRSIAEHDPGFARVYLREKHLLLPLLMSGDDRLWDMAHTQLMQAAEYTDTHL